MRINSIIIVQGTGSDHVMLQTDYPSPAPNFDSHKLCLDFSAEHDKGPEYVAKHFPGVPVELVKRPAFNFHFSNNHE